MSKETFILTIEKGVDVFSISKKEIIIKALESYKKNQSIYQNKDKRNETLKKIDDILNEIK